MNGNFSEKKKCTSVYLCALPNWPIPSFRIFFYFLIFMTYTLAQLDCWVTVNKYHIVLVSFPMHSIFSTSIMPSTPMSNTTY